MNTQEVTATLIEQRAALDAATATRIEELLANRVKIDEYSVRQHAAVTAELKALGYKRPRKVKAK